MAASADTRAHRKRAIPWWGWLLRGIGCLLASLLLAIAGLIIFYFAVVAPQERARKAEAERKAAAFARLTGPARRTAIYDAFVAAIDEHYFDRRFTGMDWRRLKREWRPKAAAAADDAHLYDDVFLPMIQAFPVSHVGYQFPAAPGKSIGAPPAPSTVSYDDPPSFLSLIRRGKEVRGVVGEVLPGSVEAKAGVQPGAIIEQAMFKPDGKGGTLVTVRLQCLTPLASHAWEGGARTYTTPLNSCQAAPGHRVSFSFRKPRGAPRLDLIVRRLPSRALYVRFDKFQKPVLDKAIAALRTAGPHGAIIDLRYNGGGYVAPLVDALFPAGQALYRRRDAQGLHPMITPAAGFRYLGPIVLLVGPSSASASEVTAAIIQSKHRGIVVGRPTNGSVLGSYFFDLPDGGEVQVPTESIEMLDGRTLEGKGVMPDVEVYPTLAELQAGKDPALEHAEAALANTAATRH